MGFSELLRYITPHRRTLTGIILLLLAGSALSLVQPLIAARVADLFLGTAGENGRTIRLLLLGWFAIIAVQTLLRGFSSFQISRTGIQMGADLRSRVYEHMQVMTMAYFHERKQGDILALLGSDANLISGFVTGAVVQLLPQLLTFVAAFLMMLWLDPLLTGLAAVLIPGYIIATKLIGRRMRPIADAETRSRSAMLAFVNENLGLMPVLKAFVREDLESQRFQEHNRKLQGLSTAQARLSAVLSPVISLLAGVGALALLWLGIHRAESGALAPADLVALLLYAMMLSRPISSFAALYGQLMATRGAAERLLDFFSEKPEPVGNPQMPIGPVRGKVEFRDVCFSYRNREPLFVNFNLTAQAGETVALVGPNGSGKSTLVHLLMRYMDPTSGHIMVDGNDIRGVDLGSLRRQIGLVSQRTLLLNGSVAENIRYGLPGASSDEIRRAAVAARADDFVRDLPEGYDTVIGDHGIKLSGGQCQRLSLARTLLKNPPILVLDEATAMFDPAGEAAFIAESRDLLEDRTVIMITHRPASLALAERIIELQMPGCGPDPTVSSSTHGSELLSSHGR